MGALGAEMADREVVHLVDTTSDESIQQEHREPETECEEKLQSWLGKIALKGHFNKMQECGLTSVSHLEDIQTRRRRHAELWNDEIPSKTAA